MRNPPTPQEGFPIQLALLQDSVPEILYTPIDLVEPCPHCKRLGTARARLRADRSIEAHCDSCNRQFSVQKKHYGAKLGLTQSEVKAAKFKKNTEKRDARIHARQNYACAYCEAERDARRFRLAQLTDRSIISEKHASTLSANIGSVEWSDLVSALGTEPRNLFGLTVDHLVEKSETDRLGEDLSERLRQKCDSVWLVSAHMGCNRAQHNIKRPLIDRINVYLRFVWPFIPGGDAQRMSDLKEYIAVLDLLFRDALSRSEDRISSAAS